MSVVEMGAISAVAVIRSAWDRADLSQMPKKWERFRVALPSPIPLAIERPPPAPDKVMIEAVTFVRTVVRPHGVALWQFVVGQYQGIEICVEASQL